MKKSFNYWSYLHIALLQIGPSLLGQGFPIPATWLFNCLLRGINPIIDKPPINADNDDEYYAA